jgi:hypothetical protein
LISKVFSTINTNANKTEEKNKKLKILIKNGKKNRTGKKIK